MPSQMRTFDEVISAYLASAKFAELRPGTKENWRRELLLAGKAMGRVPVEEMRPSVVQKFMDKLSDWPGKQHVMLTALRAVKKWARVRDLLDCDIVDGIEIGQSDGGHVPWTDEQIRLAENCAVPALARVVTLGANTGQRGSDLIRMGWTDIENVQGRAGISIKQVKTGREVWCPINETLARAMETWERLPRPFCVKPNGEPWTRPELSEAWNYERETNPALSELRAAGLVLHGLRGHACVRLYRAGLTTREVSVLVGLSLNMVERYCRFSVVKDNAVAAVIRLEAHENKLNAPANVRKIVSD